MADNEDPEPVALDGAVGVDATGGEGWTVTGADEVAGAAGAGAKATGGELGGAPAELEATDVTGAPAGAEGVGLALRRATLRPGGLCLAAR
ncbi:MAG: hypothetical protein ACYC91_01285 [Solirubrobacteraceae bacterium]